jgi:hypothetical protein
MRKKISLFILLIGLVLLGYLLLKESEPSEPVNEDLEGTVEIPGVDDKQLHAHISALTSDLFQGRRAGSEGNEKASDYIAAVFSDLDLEPMGDQGTYLSYYRQTTYEYLQPSVMEILDDKGQVVHEFIYREDFVITRIRTQNGYRDVEFDVTGEISFEAYDEKVSIFFNDHPEKMNAVHQENSPIKADVFVHEQTKVNWTTGNQMSLFIKPAIANIFNQEGNIVYVSSEAMALLKDYEGYDLRISGHCVHEEKQVANVMGRYKSSSGTDQTLMLMAHFDHLGVDPDGKINYGALDNASGTALVLDLARVLASEQVDLPFNVEFVLFNGEEDGLLGSFYEASVTPHSPKNLKVINLDMVGASKVDYLLIDPSVQVKNESMHEFFAKEAEEKEWKYKVKRNAGGSDHLPFAQMGIEVVMLLDFSDDVFDNYYHSPKDTMDMIDFKRLEDFGDMILKYIYKEAKQ